MRLERRFQQQQQQQQHLNPLSPFPRVQPPRNNNPATRERNDHRVRINNHRIQNLNNLSIPPP